MQQWNLLRLYTALPNSLRDLICPASSAPYNALVNHQQSDLSAFEPFFLLCLRARLGQSSALDAACAFTDAPGFDWAPLPAAARSARLGPLLYSVLRDVDWLPPAALEALRSQYYITALRQSLLEDELRRILDCLSAASVDVILLKGAALIRTVYETGLRPMEDLDLLVRRDSARTALEAVPTLGYATTSPEVRPGSDLAFENEVRLTRRTDLAPFALELHWSLFDIPQYQQALPLDWFWDTAQSLKVGGSTARVLAPEALLLYLCGHLTLHHAHGSANMLWYQDIAEVVNHCRDSLDWPLIFARAAKYHLVLPLQTVLHRLTTDWGLTLPPDVSAGLDALVPSPDEHALAVEKAAPRPVIRRFWNDLASTRGWSARLRYAWIQLFPSPAYMRHRYGITRGCLIPLCYPYRWWLGLRGLWSRR